MTKIFFQASTPRKASVISFSSLLINKAHPQKWMSSWPCGQHHGDGQGQTIPGRVQHTWMVQSKCSCDSPHRQQTWMRDPLKGSTKGQRAQRLWLSTVSTLEFSSVQSLSHVRLFVTPWTAAPQASLSITSSRSPPKPMSIELVMLSNHLILCCPLLLLPSIFPSIRVFSNESALHIRWPKYWSFSFNISTSSEHPGLISFRLDLLGIQGTLKSLLQHHSSKALIL